MLDLQVVDLASNKENLLPTLSTQRKRLAQLNYVPSTTRRSMWTNETLKVAMDVIKRRTHSLKRANKSWNIPTNSFFYHLNGKTKSKKMALGGVLIKEEDATMITWTLAM
jgi:transposase-like protein